VGRLVRRPHRDYALIAEDLAASFTIEGPLDGDAPAIGAAGPCGGTRAICLCSPSSCSHRRVSGTGRSMKLRSVAAWLSWAAPDVIGASADRRNAASTRLRRPSQCCWEPSSSTVGGGDFEAMKSVHSAGTRDLLPSGRMSTNCGSPEMEALFHFHLSPWELIAGARSSTGSSSSCFVSSSAGTPAVEACA
jgi:hypothetical protein